MIGEQPPSTEAFFLARDFFISLEVFNFRSSKEDTSIIAVYGLNVK
jgi:hypothetical protein